MSEYTFRFGLFLCCSSVSLSKYYVTEHEKDYICSTPEDSGISKCHLEGTVEHRLPHFVYHELLCNESAIAYSNNTANNDSCVNWNQYYSDCKAGVNNPFQGAISFDNIGLAWVAIFQVDIPNQYEI